MMHIELYYVHVCVIIILKIVLSLHMREQLLAGYDAKSIYLIVTTGWVAFRSRPEMDA